MGFCRHQVQGEQKNSFPEWEEFYSLLAEPSAMVCLRRPCGGLRCTEENSGEVTRMPRGVMLSEELLESPGGT